MVGSRLIVLLFAALLVCASAQVVPTSAYTFTSYANNASSFGSPSVSTAKGQGTFQLDTTNNILRASVVHSVTAGVAMHLHGPALPGASAPPIFFFANGGSPNYATWNVTATQAVDLLAGKYYWNIHSSTYPNGEIRGQVLAIGQSEVFLSPEFQVPPVSDNEGVGWALVTFNSATNTTAVSINSNAGLGNITAASIAGPANYTSVASSLFSLSTASLPLTGSGVINSDYLYSNSVYLSLTSSTDPNGFARGQVRAPTNFASTMVNASTPSVLGVCLVAAYPQQAFISIVHNIINPTSLVVGGNPIPLPSYASPIQLPIPPGANLNMLLQFLPTGFVTLSLSNSTDGVLGSARPITLSNYVATTTSSSTASTSSAATTGSTSTNSVSLSSTTASSSTVASTVASSTLSSAASSTASSTAASTTTSATVASTATSATVASTTITNAVASSTTSTTSRTSNGNTMKIGVFGLFATLSTLMM